MSTDGTLGYEVFVSDPIPLNVPGQIPNGELHMFSPLATTLIYGETNAVLAEAPLTRSQATVVGDWVEARGKNLTHIFASHGHGDHWFTAPMLAERFGASSAIRTAAWARPPCGPARAPSTATVVM
jgi:glyoxylase-like metal-dependent hydrolase (beta-lactamase superfamily II)